MKKVKLRERIQVPYPDQSNLILEYYLIETNEFQQSLYGIRIQSYRNNPLSSVQEEEISNLSYSKHHVNYLLSLCIHYKVTPTDLIYALDTLMNV